ncbi:HAD family hydrolase [Enhydrobacter aerosaccus]|uniref:HAD family hydrolase n=1 Tax=Enhydrobacter aerosaccus TaxID=225324 RepID=UPI001C457E11|nr:HAD family hydrolase [Enhydrobacter aerosaccus]
MRLVVFDVDGTLYRQWLLRLLMAIELLAHVLRCRDGRTLRVLRCYRSIRERMAEEERVDFSPALVAETASACAVPEAEVRAIVAEWIERRPLRYLATCRYPGIGALFEALRRNGTSIGVLSDYRAAAKLRALGLTADHVVCAEDDGVGVLKPHPKGLLMLMEAAGATPDATVVIGDRPQRDGLAARRAGARALIRSARPIDGWQTFARFEGAPFLPLLVG